LRGEEGRFGYSLDGRLRLGGALVASGQARLGWRPVSSLRLWLGYDAWFLEAGETGRSLGARCDWAVSGQLMLSAAYDVPGDNWGVGLEAGLAGARARLWLRRADWLARLSWRGDGLEAAFWSRFPYGNLTPAVYGLSAWWRAAPLVVGASYDSELGFSAEAGWRADCCSARLHGRWNPAGAALAGLELEGALGQGAYLRSSLSRAFLPFDSWKLALELGLPFR